MTKKHGPVWPNPAFVGICASRFARSLVVAIPLIAIGVQSHAESRPICPSNGAEPYPSYGELRGPPNVATWRNVGSASGLGCNGLLQGPSAHVVALAGRFEHTGSAKDLAARVGAISSTQGLPYWSTTDQDWRVLVSEASALEGPDPYTKRPDFTADEILSGRTLFFAQNDTRSTGENIYSVTAHSADPDHLSFEITNLTPIRLAFLTLFEPRTLRSVHFIERQGRDVWGYYGLSTVKSGAVDGHEKSFINRGIAFYRFLVGQPADQAPPVAP